MKTNNISTAEVKKSFPLKTYVQQLLLDNNISTMPVYLKFRKNNPNLNLPHHPERTYKEKNANWNWDVFFNRKQLNYDDSVDFNKKHNLTTAGIYRKYVKDNKTCGLPPRPEKHFKNKGWVNWTEYLPLKRKSNKQRGLEMLSYNEAKILCKEHKICSSGHYRDFIKKK